MRRFLCWTIATLTMAMTGAGAGRAAVSASAPAAAIGSLDQNWTDPARRREVPVRCYFPTSTGAATPSFPVIIFSHGLGGSREGYAYLGEYWARHGYIVVHVQHRGSDNQLLRGLRPLKALQEAMSNPETALDRPRDIRFVIDRLFALNADPSFPLHGRMDLDRLGLAGHSFGAFTTLAVAGAALPVLAGDQSFSDSRVKAAIAMSAPRTPDEDEIFDHITIPIFHFTGTQDGIAVRRQKGGSDPIVGETTPEERLRPYRRTQHAPAYLLVFEGGDHAVFSGRLTAARDSDAAFQTLVQKGSTAFWDAWLKDSEAAKTYLAGGEFLNEIGRSGSFESKMPAP